MFLIPRYFRVSEIGKPRDQRVDTSCSTVNGALKVLRELEVVDSSKHLSEAYYPRIVVVL